MAMMDSSAPCSAPRGVQDGIKQRNQRGDAFEREALGAQVTRLQDLLEEVGANQAFEDFCADRLGLAELRAAPRSSGGVSGSGKCMKSAPMVLQ